MNDENLIACIENLVGVTRPGNPCLGNIPTDSPLFRQVTTSTSGIYVDELDNLNASRVLRNVPFAQGTLWDNLLRARRQAVRDVIQSVAVAMNPQFSAGVDSNIILGLQSYSGMAGNTPGRKSYVLETQNIPGVIMTFNYTAFLARLTSDQPQNVIIEATRIVNGSRTLLARLKVPVRESGVFPGQPSSDLKPLDDMSIDLPIDGSTYEIGYEYPAGAGYVPFNNTLRCGGCPGTVNQFRQYFRNVPEGSAMGIVWNAWFHCDAIYLACALTKNSILSSLVADLVAYRTAELWITNSTNQTGTTTQTVLDLNQFGPIRDGFAAMQVSRLGSLQTQAEYAPEQLGCFVCRPYQRGGNSRISMMEPVVNERTDEAEINAYFESGPWGKPLSTTSVRRDMPSLPA